MTARAVTTSRYGRRVYPTGEVLEELGRVTIAGARLDLQLAFLLHHIDPAVELLGKVRPLSGSELTRRVRMRAELHLDEPLHGIVLTLADDADAVRRERNELVHGEWLLCGSDATRPAAEVIAAVDGTDPADAEACTCGHGSGRRRRRPSGSASRRGPSSSSRRRRSTSSSPSSTGSARSPFGPSR